MKKEERYGARLTPKGVKRFFSGLLSKEAREVPAVFLWGPPGVGKSSVVKQVAKERGLEIIDLRLSLLDAVDLRGIPITSGDTCRWSRPVFIPAEGRGILFLDELNTSSPSVQNSALQLILDRRVGEHELGNGWYLVAAGNRRQDSNLVFQLSDPLISRFIHVEVLPDVDEWLQWAVQNGIEERVIGFIKFRSDLLLAVRPDRSSVNFPCPRAWEFLSTLLQAGVPAEEAAEAAVGVGAAAEFKGWLEIYKRLPDVEGILDGTVEFNEGLEPDVVCALIPALVVRANSKSRVERLLEIALSLKRREIGVFLISLLFAKDEKSCRESELWVEIFKKYSEVVL
jgi:hypothetical protein